MPAPLEGTQGTLGARDVQGCSRFEFRKVTDEAGRDRGGIFAEGEESLSLMPPAGTKTLENRYLQPLVCVPESIGRGQRLSPAHAHPWQPSIHPAPAAVTARTPSPPRPNQTRLNP